MFHADCIFINTNMLVAFQIQLKRDEWISINSANATGCAIGILWQCLTSVKSTNASDQDTVFLMFYKSPSDGMHFPCWKLFSWLVHIYPLDISNEPTRATNLFFDVFVDKCSFWAWKKTLQIISTHPPHQKKRDYQQWTNAMLRNSHRSRWQEAKLSLTKMAM